MYTWIPLNSSADIAKIEQNISPEYDPARVVQKLTAEISDAVKAVLIEQNYIDKDYRSTYYNFYAKKGGRYLADCVRLHFFDEFVSFDEQRLRLNCADDRPSDHYFGYMVLRPTGIATIGRTVLSPDVRSGACRYIVTATFKVHVLGYKLTVQGFPSMDQHVDIAVCAHVACWSVLRHYSERYASYSEYFTHDITMMAHEFNPGGLVPSKGLEVAHAERVFQEAGTFPLHIARESGVNDKSFDRQLGAYVDSGFPLFAAMHALEHAVVVVGYDRRTPVNSAIPGLRNSWDEVDSLAIVDDHNLPYLRIPKTGPDYSAEDIDAFIVALPEKVFYSAEAVEELTPTLFRLGSVVDLPPEDESIVRYFITTGSSFRRFVRTSESEYDLKLLEAIMRLPFAQFIWVVEIATESQWAVGQVEARAVIDATASVLENMPYWLLHGRSKAVTFDRKRIGPNITSTIGAFNFSPVGQGGFTRMDKNLRPTRTR